MLLAHLHAAGRDAPDRLFAVELELAPFGGAQFAGPDEHQRRESQRIHTTRLALIAVDRAQHLAELPGLSDGGAIRHLERLQCAAQVRTRIVFTAPCSDAI